jgi:hypothetical protein
MAALRGGREGVPGMACSQAGGATPALVWPRHSAEFKPSQPSQILSNELNSKLKLVQTSFHPNKTFPRSNNLK